MSFSVLGLSPGRAVGLTGWFLLFQLGCILLWSVVLGIASVATGQRIGDGGVNPPVLIVVNSFAAFLVLRLQLRASGVPWPEFFRPRVRWIRFLPALLLIVSGAGILVSESQNWMTGYVPAPQFLRDYARPLGDLAAHPFSAPFALIVVAAVTEEFVFRGLVLRGLVSRIGPGRAIALSAGLFSVMHLNPWQVPATLVIGVLLGWVYWRTRSLALCVFGHALHNAMNLLATGLPFTIDGFNRAHGPETVLFQPWWLNLLGVALLGGGIYWVTRLAPTTGGRLFTAVSEAPPLPDRMPTAASALAPESGADDAAG